MNIFFPEQDLKSIVAKLQDALGDRKLGKIVNFDISGQDKLIVTLTKLGTSTLEFSLSKKDDSGSHYSLSKEKIALSHRALKGEVTEKIVKVIKKAGGDVE